MDRVRYYYPNMTKCIILLNSRGGGIQTLVNKCCKSYSWRVSL